MSSCDDDPAKSFLSRFRGLFGRRSRALAMGVFLLLSGVPIPPEEIELHMQIMSNAEIVQILEGKQQALGDPPAEGEIESEQQEASPVDYRLNWPSRAE